ncbi:MAG: hypothetical protein Q8O55_08820 [Dehalococcoidales bacterium]|nr:hypothetical protein [Dehalococcoidales bacterium]
MPKRKEKIPEQPRSAEDIIAGLQAIDMDDEKKSNSISKLKRALDRLGPEEKLTIAGLDDVDTAIEDYEDAEKDEKQGAFEDLAQAVQDLAAEDVDEPAPQPAAKPALPTKSTKTEFKVGDIVSHPQMGMLTVVDISDTALLSVETELGHNRFQVDRESVTAAEPQVKATPKKPPEKPVVKPTPKPTSPVKSVVKPTLKPAPKTPIIELGDIVYHPKIPGKLIVLDISDASLLKVRNEQGSEMKIGRMAVVVGAGEKEKPADEVSPEPHELNLCQKVIAGLKDLLKEDFAKSALAMSASLTALKQAIGRIPPKLGNQINGLRSLEDGIENYSEARGEEAKQDVYKKILAALAALSCEEHKPLIKKPQVVAPSEGKEPPPLLTVTSEQLALLLKRAEEKQWALVKNQKGDILRIEVAGTVHEVDVEGKVVKLAGLTQVFTFIRDDKDSITGLTLTGVGGQATSELPPFMRGIQEKEKVAKAPEAKPKKQTKQEKPKPAQVVVKKEPAKKVTKPKPQPGDALPPILPPPERYDSLQPGRERPFGACQFIIEFLKGHTSISGKEGEIAIDKPIDPARGAPQVEIVRNYKLAIQQSWVQDRMTLEEEKRIRKGKPAFTTEEAEERTRVLMNRPMNRCRMRYHSFLIYFGMLKRLGWVETTGETEQSMLQLKNLPDASPRVYYRITPGGMAASEIQVRNPLMALYPHLDLAYFRRKKEERKERMKNEAQV